MGFYFLAFQGSKRHLDPTPQPPFGAARSVLGLHLPLLSIARLYGPSRPPRCAGPIRLRVWQRQWVARRGALTLGPAPRTERAIHTAGPGSRSAPARYARRLAPMHSTRVHRECIGNLPRTAPQAPATHARLCGLRRSAEQCGGNRLIGAVVSTRGCDRNRSRRCPRRVHLFGGRRES
jgi:hypothetical protein